MVCCYMHWDSSRSIATGLITNKALGYLYSVTGEHNHVVSIVYNKMGGLYAVTIKKKNLFQKKQQVRSFAWMIGKGRS